MRSNNQVRMRRRPFMDATQLSLQWFSSSSGASMPFGPDRLVLGLTYALVALGVIMVFSASGIMAESRYGDSLYFLKRQCLWAALGLCVMHVAAHLDYRIWERATPWLVVGTLGLLVLVVIPGLGTEVKGARRWFRLGGVSIQPAEIAKVVTVIYLATFLAKRQDERALSWSGVIPPVILTGLFAGLILIEPDMGTAVVVGFLLVCLLYLGGVRLAHLAALCMILAPLALTAVWGSAYRVKRLMSFLDPWQDPTGAGFQLSQSFVALGSGEIFGVGLGAGKQKLFFLPEVHSDFVLALVGEELGFLGTSTLLIMFGLLIIKGIHIAGRAPDNLGRYLAAGMTLLVGGQALINAGVVTGLLPTKGLTLPLVSYGGSSLVITLFAMGILLSVSRESFAAGPRWTGVRR